jgi:hypothetical protein
LLLITDEIARRYAYRRRTKVRYADVGDFDFTTVVALREIENVKHLPQQKSRTFISVPRSRPNFNIKPGNIIVVTVMLKKQLSTDGTKECSNINMSNAIVDDTYRRRI